MPFGLSGPERALIDWSAGGQLHHGVGPGGVLPTARKMVRLLLPGRRMVFSRGQQIRCDLRIRFRDRILIRRNVKKCWQAAHESRPLR